jgi:hypothetical protein
MRDHDDRTLAYLRNACDIANPKARRYATAELVSHNGFDPRREKNVFKGLLEDKSPWVRTSVISSLCMRADGIDPKHRISTALRMSDEDPARRVRVRAVGGVFDVLRRIPKDVQADVMKDRQLALPQRMTNALADDVLRDVVVFQTGQLAGQFWWHPREGAVAVKRAKDWWAAQRHAAQEP